MTNSFLTKEKASRGDLHYSKENYNTLYSKYGKEKVFKLEEELETRYPIAFGKAVPERRIKILSQFLRKGGGKNEINTVS